MSSVSSVSLNLTRVPFTDLVDLALERVGGKALFANDDFFAPKENLLKQGRAIFIPDKFTENGKWMDGWESRRKRGPGHDWCLIKLGMPGVIRGLNVDTDFFIGNFPDYCSVDATQVDAATQAAVEATDQDLVKANWTEILPKTRLNGGTQNLFPVLNQERWTHLRLNIYPDGGVARFRVHGEVKPDWSSLVQSGQAVDLGAVENGGTVVACNDSFFGTKDNLIMPGRSVNMGDGWETRRKRVPGFDWLVAKLGAAGTIQKIEVDTNHFKGNFPDRCSIEGCYLPGKEILPVDLTNPSSEISWQTILPETKLQAHFRHFFESELKAKGPFTHVKLNIFPDGGVSRLRVHGLPVLGEKS